MMLWWAAWLGCGGGAPELATEPDRPATRALVDALCKLAEGARHSCERGTDKAVFDNTERIQVSAYIDREDEVLGQVTFEGRAVVVRDGGRTITTRFTHYGWGRAEALEKGVHHWAVISGAPIVDWILGEPSRPTLRALEKVEAPNASMVPPQAAGFRALRGWTLLQGVKVDLKHDELVKAFEGSLGELAPGAPHAVQIRIAFDMGEQVYRCFVDGVENEPLCAAAKQGPWPAGVGWELRQTYLMVPTESFGDTVVEAPEPLEEPAP